MKKIFVTTFFLSLGIMGFAQSWKDHTQCDKNETPVLNSNGALSTTYSTTRTSSQQKEGTQNHYNANVNGGVNTNTGTKILSKTTNVSGGGGVSRDGEKKTTNSSNTNTESHTVRYDCVTKEEKK